jgi:hypothetical protein
MSLMKKTDEIQEAASILDPKTEIGIGREAQKDLVGRAGRGYNGCATKHNH